MAAGTGADLAALAEARDRGAAVTAIDQDPDAIALATRNAAAHGVPLATVLGAAPESLRDLREPDAVFVGGGGPAVLDAAARARRAVVVTLALIDRVAPTIDRLAQEFEVTATTLQASRVKPLAGGYRLAAENAVTVIVGRR